MVLRDLTCFCPVSLSEKNVVCSTFTWFYMFLQVNLEVRTDRAQLIPERVASTKLLSPDHNFLKKCVKKNCKVHSPNVADHREMDFAVFFKNQKVGKVWSGLGWVAPPGQKHVEPCKSSARHVFRLMFLKCSGWCIYLEILAKTLTPDWGATHPSPDQTLPTFGFSFFAKSIS